MKTEKDLSQISPDDAIKILKQGNKRFLEEEFEEKNFKKDIDATSSGQHPFAAILSCIDSRVGCELIFDQGIGDIFNVRLAGNVINEDALASLEFAGLVTGSKLILVLGHTCCGAVMGACDRFEEGHLKSLVSKIYPVINNVEPRFGERASSNLNFVNEVVRLNVKHVITEIRSKSNILNKLEENGELIITGAMYNVSNGAVTFLDPNNDET